MIRTQKIMEFETIGTLTRAFLQANTKSHIIIINIDQTEIDHIKSIIHSTPNFQKWGYHWLFDGVNTKFISKDNLEDAYEDIWDSHDIDIHDINSWVPLPANDLEEGCKVFVEYTISPYLGGKIRPNMEGFEAGTTLQLLSVGLLECPDRKLDFQSLKKKWRIAS